MLDTLPWLPSSLRKSGVPARVTRPGCLSDLISYCFSFSPPFQQQDLWNTSQTGAPAPVPLNFPFLLPGYCFPTSLPGSLCSSLFICEDISDHCGNTLPSLLFSGPHPGLFFLKVFIPDISCVYLFLICFPQLQRLLQESRGFWFTAMFTPHPSNWLMNERTTFCPHSSTCSA